MKTVEKLLKNSIDTDLCCRCGTCVGVCPTNAIQINLGAVSVFPEKCVDCGLCNAVCPAEGYELSDFTYEDIQDIPTFAASSEDKSISDKAASGGFVTQTLLSLLNHGDITAAAVVVTGKDLTEPSAKYIVTASQEDILFARRSKYTQASIAPVIDYIKHNDGKYAVVGLPCHLYALSKAMEKIPALKNRIAYKIGMVCGYTYEECCIDGLLKVLGTSREETERVIGWREDGLPGNFSVRLKDGKALSMPFIDEHSVDVTYFTQNRCLLCKDCLCEYGDVVCADIGGWSNRKTLVMVRNETGQNLLAKLQRYKSMHIEPLNVPIEKTVIPFMLQEKRSGVDLRIKRNIKCGLPTTNFVGGYSPKLLLSQKIVAWQSEKLQAYARKNRDTHSREKMLKIGHRAYHRLSERFSMKVLTKLQLLTNTVFTRVSKLINKSIKKLCSILPLSSYLCARKPLRVAVIGLGRWGSQYLPMLKNSKHFKLVAAYDYDENTLKKYSKKFGFYTAKSIADLCVNYRAEAILVFTPTPTHADVFAEVSQYGLPVYMEKPIASDSVQVQQMINIANQKDKLLYVAHSMKYEPAIQRIKRILESGSLGEVRKVKIVRTVKSRSDINYPNADLYQIGVHLIDVLLFLLDGLQDSTNFIRKAHDYLGTTTFRCGKTDIFMKYGFGRFYNFSLYLGCENGYALLADNILKTAINGKETQWKIPMKNEKTVLIQLDEFYYAVREGKSFLNTKENASKIMDLCEQFVESGENV